MSKPEVVFALYRPHAGKAEALETILARHVPVLRELGLVTERPVVLARAADGTYFEVFEWRDAEAAEQAHDLPAVAEIWDAIGEVADFKTLADLDEARRPFPHFRTVR